MQLIRNDTAILPPGEAAWKRYAFMRRVQAAARIAGLEAADDEALEAECVRLHRLVMREIDG